MTVEDSDWLLGGAVRLRQADRAFKATVDAILLAAFAPAHPSDRVMDVGAGIGSVSLCLAARLPSVHVDGVELQPALCAAANANAVLNGWGARLRFREDDVAAPDAPAKAIYDGVVTNPPYLSAAAADPPQDAARRASMVEGAADWLVWAAYCLDRLKPGGWFACVHRADRLPEVLAPLSARLGAIHLVAVAPRAGEDAHRVLLRGVKGAKGPARLTPGLTLHGDGGDYSEEAQRILRAPVFLDATRSPHIK